MAMTKLEKGTGKKGKSYWGYCGWKTSIEGAKAKFDAASKFLLGYTRETFDKEGYVGFCDALTEGVNNFVALGQELVKQGVIDKDGNILVKGTSKKSPKASKETPDESAATEAPSVV